VKTKSGTVAEGPSVTFVVPLRPSLDTVEELGVHSGSTLGGDVIRLLGSSFLGLNTPIGEVPLLLSSHNKKMPFEGAREKKEKPKLDNKTTHAGARGVWAQGEPHRP
jgi:hypothetical protein